MPDILARSLRAWRAGLLGLCLASCASEPTRPVTPPVVVDPRAILVWRDSSTAGQVRPVVDDSSVYLYSYAHDASAVAKATGGLRWKRAMPVTDPSRGGNGLQLVAGVLVIGDRDLFGVDPRSGALRWQYRPSVGANPGFLSQTTDGQTIYCGSTTGHVYVVDAATGRERWATSVVAAATAVGVYRPVLHDGVVYIAYTIVSGVRGTTGVAALDATTGTVRWNTSLPNRSAENPSGSSTGVVVVGDYVVAPSGDGTVYGIARTTGNIVRTVAATVFDPVPVTNGGEIRFLTSDTNTAFLTSTSGWVTALAVTDLQPRWSAQLALGSPTDIAVDADYV